MMIYVSAFLYFLAALFGFKAYRNGSAEWRGLAFAFFVAGLGTTMISIFALNVILSV